MLVPVMVIGMLVVAMRREVPRRMGGVRAVRLCTGRGRMGQVALETAVLARESVESDGEKAAAVSARAMSTKHLVEVRMLGA